MHDVGRRKALLSVLLIMALIFTKIPVAMGGYKGAEEVLRLTSPQGIYVLSDPVNFPFDIWVTDSFIISVDFLELANKELAFDLIIWNLSDNVTAYNVKLIVGATEEALDSSQVKNIMLDGGQDGKQIYDSDDYAMGLPSLVEGETWSKHIYDFDVVPRCAGYCDKYFVGKIKPEESISLSVTIYFGSFPTNNIRFHFDAYGFNTSAPSRLVDYLILRNSKRDDVTLMHAPTLPFIPEFPFGAIVPMVTTLLAAGIYVFLKRLRVLA